MLCSFISFFVSLSEGFWPDTAKHISEEDICLWSRWYLEGKAAVQKKDESQVTQSEVDKYTAQVHIMKIVSIFNSVYMLENTLLQF